MYVRVYIAQVIGEPRVEARPGGGGELVVVPLRVNANLRAATVEELVARRKRLHAAATRGLREELARGGAEAAEALGRLLALRRAGGAEVLRGPGETATLQPPPGGGGGGSGGGGGLALFSGSRWVTLWAPELSLSAGRAYYEVEVLEAAGTLAAGVAGARFRGGPGAWGELGDDAASWGVYSFGRSAGGRRLAALLCAAGGESRGGAGCHGPRPFFSLRR